MNVTISYALRVLSLYLLILPVASADNQPLYQARYDTQKHSLSINIVSALSHFWTLTFNDQGNYQLQLSSAKPYIGPIPALYAQFDSLSGILTLPQVQAFGRYWQVTLLQQPATTFKFTVLNAQPVMPDADSISHSAIETLTPEQRYQLHDDGTVTDSITKLQWMRCALGQTWTGNTCQGNLTHLNMEDAAYAAFKSTFAGYTDWRLPSIDELKSLIYCSSGKPAYWNTSGFSCLGDYQIPTLYAGAFLQATGAVYWSTTPLQADPGSDYNLTVAFNYGHVYYGYFAGVYEAARFVRGPTLPSGPEVVGGFKE